MSTTATPTLYQVIQTATTDEKRYVLQSLLFEWLFSPKAMPPLPWLNAPTVQKEVTQEEMNELHRRIDDNDNSITFEELMARIKQSPTIQYCN